MGEMGRLVVLQAFVSFRRQPVRAKPWLKRAGWVEMKSNVVSWTGGRCAARSAHAASAGQAPGAVGAGATSTPLSQGCAAWSGPPLPAGPIRHEAPACQCGTPAGVGRPCPDENLENSDSGTVSTHVIDGYVKVSTHATGLRAAASRAQGCGTRRAEVGALPCQGAARVS